MLLVISLASQTNAWAGRAARTKLSAHSASKAASRAKVSKARQRGKTPVRQAKARRNFKANGAKLFQVSRANVDGLLRTLEVKPKRSSIPPKANSGKQSKGKKAKAKVRLSGKQRKAGERKAASRVSSVKKILTSRAKAALANRSRTRIALALGARFAKALGGRIVIMLGGRIVTAMAGKAIKALAPTLKRLRNHPVVSSVITTYIKASAAVTRQLNHWQSVAPASVASAMGKVRKYSIMSLAAFTLSKVKSDKTFLGSFFVANSVFSNLVLPALVPLGLNPATATGLHLLSTPVALGVVIARDYYLKRAAGESITFAQTARTVLASYKKFASDRFDATLRAAETTGPAAVAAR